MSRATTLLTGVYRDWVVKSVSSPNPFCLKLGGHVFAQNVIEYNDPFVLDLGYWQVLEWEVRGKDVTIILARTEGHADGWYERRVLHRS